MYTLEMCWSSNLTSCGEDHMEEQRRKPARMERRERREMQQKREGEAKS